MKIQGYQVKDRLGEVRWKSENQDTRTVRKETAMRVTHLENQKKEQEKEDIDLGERCG